MKAQQNSTYLNDSYMLSLQQEVGSARKLQERVINAFFTGDLSEDEAINAVNYVEELELCFVKSGGCYQDLYH